MMTMLRQIFIAALAVLPIKPVYSYAEFNPMVVCKDMTTDDGESFKACASTEFYTPSPMAFPDGTTMYGGGWSHYFTIYSSTAEGFDEFSPDFPVEASANIKVQVRREDDNACTVTVTTDGTEVACNSCSYCGDPNQPVEAQICACGIYSADCTNVEHGRNVQCESVDTVFFPFTQAVLPLPIVIMPPPLPPTAEPSQEEEDEEPIFETTYCRCQGRREVDPPRNTPTDGNEFYIINGITVIPLDNDICTAPSNSNDNERKLQNNNMQMMGGGGMMMNGGMMMDGFLMMNMNMGMGRPREVGRFVCPSPL